MVLFILTGRCIRGKQETLSQPVFIWMPISLLEMKTTLLLLHVIGCCSLVAATLSKTDAKKSFKAEAEVRVLCPVDDPACCWTWISYPESHRLELSSRTVCFGERPRSLWSSVERHSERGEEVLCSHQEDLSGTRAGIHHTSKSDIHQHCFRIQA